MWKKILFGITIVLCIAAGVYWFTYMKEIKTPVSSGINAIPLDAAFIFESKQSLTTWNKLSASDMWHELIGTNAGTKLNLQIGFMDSLLKSSPAFSQLLFNQSLFISAHTSGINSFNFLFVYSLPNLSYHSTLTDFIKTVDNKPIFVRTYDEAELYSIQDKNKNVFYYSFLRGTLMMSTSQLLVEDAIRQLKSGLSFSMDRNFKNVIYTAGKNVDGNLYLNYKKLPKLLNNFIISTLQEETADLSSFADYSGWDVTIKPNELLLSGFTQANDSSISFLNLFTKQNPQEIELTKIIPSRTSFLFFMGLSNVKSFYKDHKVYLNYKQKLQKQEQYIAEINKTYQLNIERFFTDWIKNEMALVISDPVSGSVSDNSYAVIGADNISDADKTLNALVDSICKKNVEKKDTVHYNDYIITHLNLPGVLANTLGWQFKNINDNYFTTVDDYVVFANSTDALKRFIYDFEHNKTLEKNNSYRSFMSNISAEANIYLYASIPRVLNFSNDFLQEELATPLADQQDHLQKFDKIGLQFSTNKKLFYSGACITFNSLYGNELKPEWETKLDTSFHFQPFLVNNLKTDTKDIFLQDDTNTIYSFDDDGKINWKRALHEPILGSVFQPRDDKKHRVQILFNTSSHLYKIDENGKDYKAFPIKFNVPASNPIEMVNYDVNGEYRFFAAFENNLVRCFNIQGEEVLGYKALKTDNRVTLPAHYFKVNTKDYICIIDVEGKIYITDRRGEIKIKLKERFPQAIEKFFIEAGSDNEHTYLIAADSTGKITRISLGDSKEQFRFKRFDPPVHMDYTDINNDNQNDYVFLSGKELNVYDQQKKILLNYKFKEHTLPYPLVMTLPPDQTIKIGAVSSTGNQIYLLNSNGSSTPNFPVKGKTLFTIGNITNEDVLFLITGSAENNLIAYPLE